MIETVQASQPDTIVSPDKVADTKVSSHIHDKDKYQLLAHEIEDFDNLHKLALSVSSTLDLNKVIWRLYKESSRILKTTNFALVIYQTDTQMLNCNLVVSKGKPIPPFTVNPSSNGSLISQTLTNQDPLLLQDLQGMTTAIEFGQNPPLQHIKSWLGIPIINPTSQQVQGLIAVWDEKPNAFTEHKLKLLAAIGALAAVAMRNAQIFEAAQRRATEMAMLNEISQRRATEMALLNDIARTLSSTLQLDKVLAMVVTRVHEVLDVEHVLLFLVDALTGDLIFQRARGENIDNLKAFRIGQGQGIAGQTALNHKPMLVTRKDLNRQHLAGQEQVFDQPVRNILCVPLISHEQVIGVLEVVDKREENFVQNDLELLSSIASYAAIAIENARLHENVLTKRDEVIEAEEAVRRDLARDLHDGPTQIISSIMMRLDFCKMLLEKEPEKLGHELDLTHKLADQAIHEIRTLLFEMRPLILEAQGLSEALNIFIERHQKDVEGKTGLSLEVNTPHLHNEISRLDTKIEAAIFAIVQESINNALKHAKADNIVVQVKETASALYIIVTDDGIGFDMEAVLSNYQQRESLGLINIRERTQLMGAELTMRSTPGEGTHITIYLPKAQEERLRKRGTGPLSLPLDMPQNGNKP